MNLLAALALALPLTSASGASPAGFPFTNETLNYSIVWPSGLSLGEAKLSASRTDSNWTFDLMLDAAVPGYAVKDSYHAAAGLNLCSTEFDRESVHGTKKTSEKTAIGNGKATRQTVGGGKSEIAVAQCAHDALTYLYVARREFGQGRVPASETILFGAGYRLELHYTGAQSITLGGVETETDHVACSVNIKENQKYDFEIFFARDVARTPLLIRAPFALGAISMELVH